MVFLLPSRSVVYVTPKEEPGAPPIVREVRPSEAPKPRLLGRVRQAMRAKHYRRRMEKAYVAWARRYILFHGKGHPAEMGAPEVARVRPGPPPTGTWPPRH